jgi:hypothetical protein
MHLVLKVFEVRRVLHIIIDSVKLLSIYSGLAKGAHKILHIVDLQGFLFVVGG